MIHKTASLFFVGLFVSCFAAASASIVITGHTGNNNWWVAYAVSDASTTNVEFKDSGAYSSWKQLTGTNWGYWYLATEGFAVTFPISFRLTAGSSQVVASNVFSSSAPGVSADTGLSYASSSSSSPPSVEESSSESGSSAGESPSGQEPATAPTQAPTQGATVQPSQKPTHKPKPTKKPVSPPTSQPPVQPTQPPAQPTQPPAQPTQPAQVPITQPTQRPVTQSTERPVQPTQPPQPTQPSQPTQKPTQASTSPSSNGNPFAGTEYYLNPHYTIEVDSAIAAYPAQSAKMNKVKQFASAFWIDRIAVIDNVTTVLTQARLQSNKSGNKVMAALVIYDLPSRDCAALASNGELSCADAECADGINAYKHSYIDKVVQVLSNFPDITIVTVVEPDSLPNMATNLGMAKCALAQKAYKTGVAYAIQQLSTLSNVHIYVDAAHGGWLGWSDPTAKAVEVFSEVLSNAGGASKIRGFATNVANYQPLGSLTDTADPCNLASQYNFATNEVKFVSLLDSALTARGITGMKYIIDTGRNGVINARSDCSNWCNINRAGLGVPPTTNTALSIIDAYFWVKPPGESDGSSDSSAPRFDPHCASGDSATPAPQAGNWFPSYFSMLVNNANPSL